VHSSLLRQLDADLLAEDELPLRSYEVLLLLEGAPGRRLRMSDLSRSVLLSPSGVTRLVDRLERDGRGLNLCFETRMGILNHTTGEPKSTLEADVVRLSDRIAYINHDLDDAERAGIIRPGEEPTVVRERIGKRNSERINAIVTDVIENSGSGTLRMSPPMSEAVDEFTAFMYAAVYKNPVAKSEESKVENILRGIWEYYVNHAERLPEDYRHIADEDGLERTVTDYVSGMTDSFAMETYSDIFIPAAWRVK
jgi:dGTPase